MSKPIIPWIGGKRRLAKHLLPLFPEHQCYVELFCGAAALFFMKEPTKTEVLNDINGERDYTFFYADPPYWDTVGYGVDFGMEQYEALAEAAKSMKGKMIISLNDHPEMRRVFKGLDIKKVAINYTVAGGGKAQRASELIIKNW